MEISGIHIIMSDQNPTEPEKLSGDYWELVRSFSLQDSVYGHAGHEFRLRRHGITVFWWPDVKAVRVWVSDGLGLIPGCDETTWNEGLRGHVIGSDICGFLANIATSFVPLNATP